MQGVVQASQSSTFFAKCISLRHLQDRFDSALKYEAHESGVFKVKLRMHKRGGKSESQTKNANDFHLQRYNNSD